MRTLALAVATCLSLGTAQHVHASVLATYGCYLRRPSAEARADAWKYQFILSEAEVCFGANGFTREVIRSIDPTWVYRPWMTYDETHTVIGHDTCVVKAERNGNLSFSACSDAGLWELECIEPQLLGTCAGANAPLSNTVGGGAFSDRIVASLVAARRSHRPFALTSLPHMIRSFPRLFRP